MMTTPSALLKTPLHANHTARGAKLVGFGGWDMPLQFGKVLDEHHAVRNAAGLFDIAHMGILSVSGPDLPATLKHLNRLIPQDLTMISAGKAVYTQLLNPSGGILDDIIVYWLPPLQHFPELTQFMVICNAANTPVVRDWFAQNLPTDVRVDYLNAQYSLLALQGPQFEAILRAAGLPPQAELPKRFHLVEASLNGLPVLLSRTGYTGEDGVEILTAADQVVSLWNSLLKVGGPLGLLPIGLAARDTLRLEAAYPLHGSELSPDITPLEAGLGWSVKLDQADDFIGRDALRAQKANGMSRRFICLEMLQKSIARHGDVILDADGRPVGDVTSGSISPTLGKPIAVGYVHGPETLPVGTSIQVVIRGNPMPATTVARPFYTHP